MAKATNAAEALRQKEEDEYVEQAGSKAKKNYRIYANEGRKGRSQDSIP